ncbi:hypothetical protein [Algoriphagus antarcticus]|uniref:Uncharacterized protein n=1 Tax=Algoriphagus antarcticus TaxID=238540 RepID=A0A3E0E341_9BACT|nr:hypothetical protein [Algoriphagus antarcticus]REG92153.1 hypothetical protein C8N25_103232 [Algoriphagus antarcticus]
MPKEIDFIYPEGLFKDEETKVVLNRIFVGLISRYYFLTKDDLIRYRSILYFGEDYLMFNQSINWDLNLIERLANDIAFDAIHKTSITFDIAFFRRFDTLIDYSRIIYSKKIKWSGDLVDFIGDKIIWNRSQYMALGYLKLRVLRKYADVLDWKRISSFIAPEYVDEFSEKIDWNMYSLYGKFPDDNSFISGYKGKIDFDCFSSNPTSLPFINRYPNLKKWNWKNVIVNRGVEYNKHTFSFILSNFVNQLKRDNSKYRFIGLKYFFHSLFSIERGLDLSFFYLNDNIHLIPKGYFGNGCPSKLLTPEVLRGNIDRINWENPNLLDAIGIHDDFNFVIENIERFDKSRYAFYKLKLTQKFVKEYEDKISWFWLSSCENLDWDLNFIKENFHRFHLLSLSRNKGIYDMVFKEKDKIFLILEKNLK